MEKKEYFLHLPNAEDPGMPGIVLELGGAEELAEKLEKLEAAAGGAGGRLDVQLFCGIPAEGRAESTEPELLTEEEAWKRFRVAAEACCIPENAAGKAASTLDGGTLRISVPAGNGRKGIACAIGVAKLKAACMPVLRQAEGPCPV